MIETLVYLFIVLLIFGLVWGLLPRLGLEPPFLNAAYVVLTAIAILFLIGFLPQVGWWHR